MPAVHVEVERKFDVPTDFVLPDLAGVDGVAGVDAPEERQLEAVYHDTPDLRLARARVTMRRRTGGPDAGWHVKLPETAGARRELHSPLGRAGRTPPKTVQEPVTGIVRGAPVGPVASLQTRRLVTLLRADDGRVLAEVADDTVTGTAFAATPDEPATVQVWRELEVELVDGDEAVLAAVAERLVAAGASPSPSPSKLARVLTDRLAAVDGGPALPKPTKKTPRDRWSWPRWPPRCRRCRTPTCWSAPTRPTACTTCASPAAGCAASSPPTARWSTGHAPTRCATS